MTETTQPTETDHVDRFLAELDVPTLDLTVEGIVDRIMGISRRLRRSMNDTLEGFGLTWEEWKLLCALRNNGEPYRLSPGQLARAQELSSGAMTNRLDQLEPTNETRIEIVTDFILDIHHRSSVLSNGRGWNAAPGDLQRLLVEVLNAPWKDC